ncbi:MAG: anti-sigma factor [Acidothermus sp.]|nr:anti-sigma factor [Acidothermus sp.]MCL6538298.1 anti-sigma factor [Acidothermus sp.]
MSTSHEPWEELAAAYALHALDHDELHRFEEHLAGCRSCRELLVQYQLTAAHLASLADSSEVTPPEWEVMRRRVVGVGPAHPRPTVSASPAGRVRRHRGRRARWGLSGRRVSLRTALVTTAAAVAVSVGLTVWVAGQPSRPQNLAATCAAQASCRVITLQGTAGRVVLVVEGQDVAVVSNDLAPVEPREMYVLWQQPEGGAPVPLVGYRQVGPTGVWVHLTAPLDRTKALMVSAEPEGGLPAKASNVLAAAELGTHSPAPSA